MRDYELVLIVKPEVQEEGVKVILDKVGQTMAARGGSIDETTPWGKRRLAYPVKHYREGNYVLLKCKLSPDSVGDIETSLKLSEDVLRHMLSRA